ncbi:hypothetical protein STCU_06827 [Strigomonas culicis]|uniref:Uncharacterized protein n=1 Tax=Strigomonas culicis TaxID=28005 RepID=S9VDP6_9TRYP|nr:hypothetical protein STCU_06827 [Strigomonas culicis]|eukprot:EPY25131.1 hypothetical protein STCU_06827 [Strigomonas culicis]
MKKSVESWNGGFHNFMAAAAGNPQEVRPWELLYDERRQLSHEPRIVQQIKLESEWSQPPMLGIWKRIQQFALPAQGYAMPNAAFLQFLETNGINSATMRQTLLDFYREGFHIHGTSYKDVPLHGLLLCKVLALGLQDSKTGAVLLDHCFRSLSCCMEDFDAGVLHLSRRRLQASVEELTARREAATARRKRRVPLSLAAQLEEQRLLALDQLWPADETGAVPDVLDAAGFHHLLHSNSELSSYFVKPLLEATLTCFRPVLHNGEYSTIGVKFPAVPFAWQEMLELEEYDKFQPGDADALLLHDVEKDGKDPNAVPVTKKKKKKATKK